MPWAQFVFRSLGLTALLVVSLRQLNRGFTRSDRQIRVTRSMIFYVLVSAVSAAFSIHRGKSLEAMLNLLAITGLFLAAAMLVRGSRMLRGFALVEVLAAIPVAAYGILQHFRPELLPAANSYPGRALGPFGQPNRLGGYLAAAIPVALALSFVIHDRALKGALLLAVFGLMFCLVATYSRGAWIGLAAGLLVLAAALFRWPELQPRPAHLWTSLACVALPALLLLPSIIARIEAKPSSKAEWRLPIDPEREGSGAMRLVIWKESIAAGLNRPAVGSGIGAFREAYDRYKG
ncbi:MAG: O-antigen ligase family protein, partial [Candidatus Latescibacteria bacterium]|nr:O-antigen ligase family protein [Candidatus Latescibacterota bacterium]